jgi:hypothetical protein
MAGRPTKLTPELTQLICENIELGLSYDLSSQAVGISRVTFSDWMKNGAAGTEERFIDFYNAVKAAEATCAKNCLTRIRSQAESGSLAADTWLLERRYHEDYGRKDNFNIKSKSENLNVNFTEDQIEERRSKILEGLLADLATESVEKDNC